MKKFKLFLILLGIVLSQPFLIAQKPSTDMDAKYFPERPLSPRRFANDLAQCFGIDLEMALDQKLASIKSNHGYSVYVVTHINEGLFNGEFERKQYATNLTRLWELGSSQEGNRMLCLYIATDRTPNEKRFVTSLRTAGGSSGIFTDVISKRIREQFNREVFSLGLEKATQNFIDAVDKTLYDNKAEVNSQAKNTENTSETNSKALNNDLGNFFGSVFIIGILSAIVYYLWNLVLWYQRRRTYWKIYGEMYAKYNNQKILMEELLNTVSQIMPSYLAHSYESQICNLNNAFKSYEKEYFQLADTLYQKYRSDAALKILASIGNFAENCVEQMQKLRTSIDIEVKGDTLKIDASVTELHAKSVIITSLIQIFGKRYNINSTMKQWDEIANRAYLIFAVVDTDIKKEISERDTIIQEINDFHIKLEVAKANEEQCLATKKIIGTIKSKHIGLTKLVDALDSFSNASLNSNARYIVKFNLDEVEKLLIRISQENDLSILIDMWNTCFSYVSLNSVDECIKEVTGAISSEKLAKTQVFSLKNNINLNCFARVISDGDISSATLSRMRHIISILNQVEDVNDKSICTWSKLYEEASTALSEIDSLIKRAHSEIEEAENERVREQARRQAEAEAELRRREAQQYEDSQRSTSSSSFSSSDSDSDSGSGGDGGGD